MNPFEQHQHNTRREFLTTTASGLGALSPDEMALGAMDMVRARGMSIPGDMSVIGFDNSPLSRYLHPKLSTVNFPVSDIGRMAAHLVLQNVYEHNGIDIKHVFEPTLVERASTGPLAH